MGGGNSPLATSMSDTMLSTFQIGLVIQIYVRTQIFITEKPQHVKVSFSSVIVLIWRNRLNIIRRSDCRISSPVHRWGGFERTRWRRTMLFGAEYKGFGSGQR